MKKIGFKSAFRLIKNLRHARFRNDPGVPVDMEPKVVHSSLRRAKKTGQWMYDVKAGGVVQKV